MLSLIALLSLSFFTFVVIIAVGVTVYEVFFVDRNLLRDRDYTRSYDWTNRDF